MDLRSIPAHYKYFGALGGRENQHCLDLILLAHLCSFRAPKLSQLSMRGLHRRAVVWGPELKAIHCYSVAVRIHQNQKYRSTGVRGGGRRSFMCYYNHGSVKGQTHQEQDQHTCKFSLKCLVLSLTHTFFISRPNIRLLSTDFTGSHWSEDQRVLRLASADHRVQVRDGLGQVQQHLRGGHGRAHQRPLEGEELELSQTLLERLLSEVGRHVQELFEDLYHFRLLCAKVLSLISI